MKVVAKHVQIKTPDDNCVHLMSENSYTLCALESCGDSGLGFDEGIIVNKKIDCPDCIEIVKFCKSILPSELKVL